MQAENKTLLNQLHPKLIARQFGGIWSFANPFPAPVPVSPYRMPLLSCGLNRRGENSSSSTLYLRVAAPGSGGKKGRISLLLAKIPLYTAPSHTETWLKRPSGGSRAEKARLLTRFRRNQPEN